MLFKKITALIAALAVPAVFACSANAAEFNLKLQTYYSPTTATGAKFFADQVKKLTDGKVEIQVFTGGELVGSANILTSVKSGMIDIGHGMGHHFTERKSGLVESGLPMGWTSATEAQILYDQRGLREMFAKDYEKLGVVYLGPVWAAPFTTLSKKPIRSLDDMRKMKIRAVGAVAKMLTKLGVNVVSLPPEDIYMALTTGQIDGVVYGSAAEYKETKYYEAAGWLNVTPLLDPITDSLIINKKVWEKFTPQMRASIQAAADMTRWHYYTWGESESVKVLDEIFKDKITSFSTEDMNAMTKAASEIWEQESQKSPEVKAAVDVLKEFAKAKGRI
ncbi:MAG: TRAP transporter substrate-binding protein DctP [Mailhella sp.]|nr:TRAP transporter substrate-binding protein DctP [Mailhella sp.]